MIFSLVVFGPLFELLGQKYTLILSLKGSLSFFNKKILNIKNLYYGFINNMTYINCLQMYFVISI